MDEFSFFTKLEPVYEIYLKWYAHAIPHRLDPLPTEDAEDDHEAVHEVREVPSWHHTSGPQALLGPIVIPVQLHAHHGKDEDDDANHKGEVGETPDYASHDGQDVV